jgi:integrase
LFARPKESSDIRRSELTKGFGERYGDVPIFQVGDEIVAEWLAGGKRAESMMGLSSMFADAASMKAGRLIDRSPFEKLGISRGKGRRDQQPPSEQEAWEIIECARRVSCPSFAAWLQVAAFTGMRPGELECVALGADRLRARPDRGGGAVQRCDPEVRHAKEPPAS